MKNFPLPRIDKDKTLREMLLQYCRLKDGDVWNDPEKKHVIACLDAADSKMMKQAVGKTKATLAVQDPPYNFVAFKQSKCDEFISWCEKWIKTTDENLADNSSLYIWLGADQKDNLKPFPEFIFMMRETGYESKSFITLRNQRGYGTQKNWMSLRQELLFYTKGKPVFNSESVYTEIPKVVKGYYKEIGGEKKENLERSKSNTIRAGNVWIDIQQVFHLMEENVNGCFAQKPLKSAERIIATSSCEGDKVLDFFSHSGTTLLACEKLNRKCVTIDIDPIYCEISIRRLERLRKTGKFGWQNSNPFANEIFNDSKLQNYLVENYDYKIPEQTVA